MHKIYSNDTGSVLCTMLMCPNDLSAPSSSPETTSSPHGLQPFHLNRTNYVFSLMVLPVTTHYCLLRYRKMNTRFRVIPGKPIYINLRTKCPLFLLKNPIVFIKMTKSFPKVASLASAT